MVVVYLQRDINQAIERYIHLRENVGMSREDARIGAIMETRQAVEMKMALVEDGILQADEQVALIHAGKRVTDKLNPKQVNQ